MRLTRLVLLISLLALVVAPAALAFRFTDASYNVPTGTVGTSYLHQFEISPGGGCPPYKFYVMSGASLPPGLTLGESDGKVTGTPTAAGSFSVWIQAKDTPAACGFPATPPASTERQFTFQIQSGLSILQASVPSPAFVSEPYSVQLSTDRSGSTWTVQSGTLPAGVGLASSGLLSGTPAAAGDYSFVAKATNGSTTATRTYSVKVLERLKVTKPVTAPAAEVGKAFALEVKATGGQGSHTWSLGGGTTLPAGLTLDSASGAISGKPKLAGSFPVNLSVSDGAGQTDTVDLTIDVAAKLVVIKRALPAAKVGSPYHAKLLVTGGVAPRKWKILGGLPGFLPPGIKFNAKTGQLSGTPTKSGVWRLRFQVIDKLGAISSVPVLLKVNA